ncbi:MAG: DUF1318 domain-containing protein [Magnetococcales bacterium]|nr:DUF1318 domain-containing protein [Magnetococcales bacterium]
MKQRTSLWAVFALSTFVIFSHLSFSEAGGSLSPSQVSTYKQAKSQGKLIEAGNGYLTIGPGGGSLSDLMNQVNMLRKEKYQQIAKQNGVPLQAVEASAGQKLLAD